MSKRADNIYEMLSSGELQPRQIKRRLGCSLTSVRLALCELEEQGRALREESCGRSPEIWRAIPLAAQSKALKLITSKWDSSLRLTA